MKIKDLMTNQVSSLNPKDSVENAAQIMKEHNVGSIPVCDGERVIGIVTDRDIAIRSVAQGGNTKHQSVREVMTSNPVLAKPDMDIKEAERIMSERQIRRLPIVENSNLVGMLSMGDIALEPQLTKEVGDTLKKVSEPSTPEY